MSQDDIRSLFSSIGDIESCKLIRDKSTGAWACASHALYVTAMYGAIKNETLENVAPDSMCGKWETKYMKHFSLPIDASVSHCKWKLTVVTHI